MASKSNYGRIPIVDDIDPGLSSEVLEVIGHSGDEGTNVKVTSAVASFEVDQGNSEPIEIFEDDQSEGFNSSPVEDYLFSWTDPWLLNALMAIVLVFPLMTTAIFTISDLTGRSWPSTLFAFHLALSLWTAKSMIPVDRFGSHARSTCRRVSTLILDLCLFGLLYHGVWTVFISAFFTEIDGTTVTEWADVKDNMELLRIIGRTVAALRLIVDVAAISALCYTQRYNHNLIDDPRLPQMFVSCLSCLDEYWVSLSVSATRKLCSVLQWLLWVLFSVSILLFVWCFNSAIMHLISWSPPPQFGDHCDPFDTTECCLPFPSFHHLLPDNTTVTGWRVNLQGETLPPLKGGIQIDPSFLNKLDGFSTMAPLLFYIDGLKEAHRQPTNNTVRLQGHENIEESVTKNSITLLVDVSTQKLVHHSAEIDYLDEKRPLVLVFPAQPLNHNTHYALAVVGATDIHGELLSPTPGMKAFFADRTLDAERFRRYKNKVIPALRKAAPWVPRLVSQIQLIFDFHTVSAESQLGPVRKVRDATMRIISDPSWGNWKDHVRVIRKVEGACSKHELIARTIHAELDVPWFLNGFGVGQRQATLDNYAVESGASVTMGKAKFVVHVPCSLRAAAVKGPNATDLRAIMEFGHGLFFSRDEASDGFLQKMANDEGYIIMAMDWRGMSVYDLPIVIKTLMAKPRLFHAIRDNLIQGYANKFALQHFSQNGMLDLQWLQFHTGFNRNRPVPTYQNRTPASVFYGISQGGILGAGYAALSGPTKLIDRAILGVPGTPFALVMSRSLDFSGYDSVLLLNFYSNRHVRILLYLTQMAWDSVEGSGVLAGPKTEEWPRMLLQAGLGDAVVPSLSAEALARGLGASALHGNPRKIFGVGVGEPASNTSLGPNFTLTELLYEKEYTSLPTDDRFASRNDVHICVRRDEKLIGQIKEFMNTGRIIDPCLDDDRCHRRTAECHLPWRDD